MQHFYKWAKDKKLCHGRAYVQIATHKISASPKTEKEHHHWHPCEISPKMHMSYVQFGERMLKQWTFEFETF